MTTGEHLWGYFKQWFISLVFGVAASFAARELGSAKFSGFLTSALPGVLFALLGINLTTSALVAGRVREIFSGNLDRAEKTITELKLLVGEQIACVIVALVAMSLHGATRMKGHETWLEAILAAMLFVELQAIWDIAKATFIVHFHIEDDQANGPG